MSPAAGLAGQAFYGIGINVDAPQNLKHLLRFLLTVENVQRLSPYDNFDGRLEPGRSSTEAPTNQGAMLVIGGIDYSIFS